MCASRCSPRPGEGLGVELGECRGCRLPLGVNAQAARVLTA